jgi:hypothetical protein
LDPQIKYVMKIDVRTRRLNNAIYGDSQGQQGLGGGRSA